MTPRAALSGHPRSSPCTRHPLQQRGFTLLEVLVALAILSLAIVAAIQGFAQGLRLLKLAGDHQHAALIADQKLHEMTEPTEGRQTGTEGPFAWERTTTVVDTPELNLPGVPARWHVYRIGVAVRWGGRQVEIDTLRTVAARSQAEAGRSQAASVSGHPRSEPTPRPPLQ